MSLRQFRIVVNHLLSTYINCELKGCAIVYNSPSVCEYSASIRVVTEGLVPIPTLNNLESVNQLFQYTSVPGFTFVRVQYVAAAFGDADVFRWQLRYVLNF